MCLHREDRTRQGALQLRIAALYVFPVRHLVGKGSIFLLVFDSVKGC